MSTSGIARWMPLIVLPLAVAAAAPAGAAETCKTYKVQGNVRVKDKQLELIASPGSESEATYTLTPALKLSALYPGTMAEVEVTAPVDCLYDCQALQARNAAYLEPDAIPVSPRAARGAAREKPCPPQETAASSN